MKNIVIAIFALLAMTNVKAVERLPVDRVNNETLTQESQVMLSGTNDRHLAMVWWIPIEFWLSLKSQNKDMKVITDALSNVSLLAVVQADISNLGAFRYYSNDQIAKQMTLVLTDTEGKKKELKLMQTINPDLEVLLGMMKPMLSAAMGNLGSNMQFYVINDNTDDKKRVLDPYKKGTFTVRLQDKNSTPLNANIELPLNSLFVPRKCANGKPAHISWNYCPWSGERLPE